MSYGVHTTGKGHGLLVAFYFSIAEKTELRYPPFWGNIHHSCGFSTIWTQKELGKIFGGWEKKFFSRGRGRPLRNFLYFLHILWIKLPFSQNMGPLSPFVLTSPPGSYIMWVTFSQKQRRFEGFLSKLFLCSQGARTPGEEISRASFLFPGNPRANRFT